MVKLHGGLCLGPKLAPAQPGHSHHWPHTANVAAVDLHVDLSADRVLVADGPLNHGALHAATPSLTLRKSRRALMLRSSSDGAK